MRLFGAERPSGYSLELPVTWVTAGNTASTENTAGARGTGVAAGTATAPGTDARSGGVALRRPRR
ncbi:hypothetical protein GTY88_04480, partial [Streptomyces sp. SID5926]|nr:hypothetical protein [Streptomyces sp. SID5926]